MSKGLDKYRHYPGPDQAPNCLQRLSANKQVAAIKEIVKTTFVLLTPIVVGKAKTTEIWPFFYHMRLQTMWYVPPAKGSDQPAHTRSLIRAFASRFDILRLLGY